MPLRYIGKTSFTSKLIYFREWVLPNADWTQRGTLRERADVPNWLLDLTIWVNSHWQELDILNRTGNFLFSYCFVEAMACKSNEL